MGFTRNIKLYELEGIISNSCLVAIREAGSSFRDINYRIPFSKALYKFGNYTVWFIDPLYEDMLAFVVSENEV